MTDWQNLSLLRFALAWLVLSVHLKAFVAQPASWIMAFDAFGGKAAVMGFLLVSGYSIAASLERHQSGFYRRRFLRIYPLYFAALVLAGALQFTAGDLTTLELPVIVNGGVDWFTFVGNVLMLQTFVVKPLAFDGPVWSLAVEASFYLAAPLFMRMRRTHLMALVVFSAACYALPQHTDWGIAYYVLSKLNALRYLWCWLLGFLLRLHPGREVGALAVLGALPIVIAANGTEPLAIVTYLATLALIAAATRYHTPRSWRKVADYLGDISYPLYLLHFPAFLFGLLYLEVQTAGPMIVLSLALSLAMYHLVDRYLKPRFLVPLVMGSAPRRVALDV